MKTNSIKWFTKSLIVNSVAYAITLLFGCLTVGTILKNWLRLGNALWIVNERKVPPKCLQDVSYGRHSFTRLQNNLKIHYVENGDPAKPLMLFVHGFPEFWFSWRGQLKHFAKTHWVVAMDMRGYGDSDKPANISAYTSELLERDIYYFIKALKRDKCILVGHDWGGVFSWGVGSKYPDVVDKLVILNAPHPSTVFRKIITSPTQIWKAWYIFMCQLPYLPEMYARMEDMSVFRELFGSSITDDEIEAFKYIWSKKGAWTPAINCYRNILSENCLLYPGYLPNIVVPTLVIWGDNDVCLENDFAERSKACGKDIRVQYIPNGSHFIQQDKPEEVNLAIEKFLGI